MTARAVLRQTDDFQVEPMVSERDGRDGEMAANATRMRAQATGVARRWAWNACGAACLGLAGLGAVLPLLPTTCFLLLAAACFSRGSERAHRWMFENRWFGRQLDDYRRHRVLPPRVKLWTLGILWLSIAVTCVAVDHLAVRVVLAGIAAAVTAHVAMLADRPVARVGGAR
jgi:uncharacterized membrane protein YbaN (DUF454 family)